MSRISPRALLVSKTCPSRASSGAAATGRRDPARAVATAPVAMPWAPVPSMTSVMLGPTAPSTWLSLSPAIAASTVAVASPVISPTWLCPTASTPVVSSNGPSVLSPKMACPTKLPVGTCGATTASSSPTPPSRTGSRPPGKKMALPLLSARRLGFQGPTALFAPRSHLKAEEPKNPDHAVEHLPGRSAG